jgi:hypothetical protein
MTEDERLSIKQRLKDDFAHYAARCLTIRAKDGALQHLDLNRAQKHIHKRLEAQKDRTGKVRALVLKGRQQGVSTLIGARFYHAVTHLTGRRVFILTHEDAATANLFEMVQRFHDNLPPAIKPETGAANAKELAFSSLDSGYKVGTAGTKGVGRSSTIQFFHASECAFWPHAETHESGVLQAVPDEPGTEVILESTANGLGNMFHRRWRDAELGVGDYQAIFVPWYWDDGYARAPGPRFVLDVEEAEYAEAYGLSDAQIAWRRAKIIELKSPVLFRQEYPATAAEAFQMSGHDSYIAPELVARARHTRVEPHGPLVIGYDPAWKGDDRSSMAWRRGRSVYRIESKHGIDTMQGAGWAKQVIDRDRPKRMFIDVGGIGAGIYDRLCEMGYDEVVQAVNFGSSPLEPQPEDVNGIQRGGPRNRRAEMWMWLKDWLEDPAGVSIPDSDSLQADICGPGYKWDSNTRLLLESKDDMRRRGVLSPDEGDAVALTFAEPVAPEQAYTPPVREWVV